MPLPGGEADKVGNRYECRWTINCLIDVLEEKALSIQVERAGEDAFEFILETEKNYQYHQVKRQNGQTGHWTISSLENNKISVLSSFWNKLSDPKNLCYFVSTQDASMLNELSTRARSSNLFNEFIEKYCNSKKYFTELEKLIIKWGNCSKLEAYQALRRIYVETVGEDFLLKTIENRLESLFEEDPKKVRIELGEFIINSLNKKVSSFDIWDYLQKERAYHRRAWGKDPKILSKVSDININYCSALKKHNSIKGNIIERKEVQIAFDLLTKDDKNVLITGKAGIGKTCVILQISEKLMDEKIPFLVLRIDRLHPEIFPDKIGDQLGLPGSPETVLSSLDKNKVCVLVIDQLDSVSMTSGRNPDFFECIELMIEQAQAYSNVKILIACRKFDLDNDHRFKDLVCEGGLANELLIEPLSKGTIKETLTKIGVNHSQFSNKQLDLLSIPLHLSLLGQIINYHDPKNFQLSTIQDIYEKFWKYKQEVLKINLKRPVNWVPVINTLCNYMSGKQQQTLSAPESILDEYQADANAMVSENVLILENKRYSFFHESFFDYAFARQFCGKEQTLLSFIGNYDNQLLFRRSQVRQILIYERGVDFTKYLCDFKALLKSNNVRFHIKQCIITLLTTIDDPRIEEWEILESLIIESNNPCSEKVWGLLRSSYKWFQVANDFGFIEKCLSSNEEVTIKNTFTVLSLMQREIPDEICKVVNPLLSQSSKWMDYYPDLLQFVKLENCKEFFDLFLDIVDTGALDVFPANSNDGRSFWWLIYKLPTKKPAWGSEAIGRYFNHKFQKSLEIGNPNPFNYENGTIQRNMLYEEALIKCASSAPEAYIENILPFMLHVISNTIVNPDKTPLKDINWQYRKYHYVSDIDDAILNGMEIAIKKLAKESPEKFCFLYEEQFIHSGYETIQYLLIQAYSANGEYFADKAIAYICSNKKIFSIGYMHFPIEQRASNYYPAFRLLKNTTKFCSKEKLKQIQDVILDYSEDKNQTINTQVDYAKFLFLNAIPYKKLSQHSKACFRKLEHQFDINPLLFDEVDLSSDKSYTKEARLLKSPIDKNAANIMTDEQWLEAIIRYNTKENYNQDLELTGGAFQLSPLLEESATNEPERFSSLVDELPDNANPVYFNAILRGIAKSDVEVEIAYKAIWRCHNIPNRPCGNSICWCIKELPNLSWPKEALNIVKWYALCKPNSPDVLLNDAEIDSINSCRVSAVNAITLLISKHSKRIDFFKDTLKDLIYDSSLAVKVSIIEALITAYKSHKDFAMSLFLSLLETDISLLEDEYVEDFLTTAVKFNADQILPILTKMISLDKPLAKIRGSRIIAKVSLENKNIHYLLEECISGEYIQRKAVAEVFSLGLKSSSHNQFCQDKLIALFNDTNVEVQYEASKCFFFLENKELSNYSRLVNMFIESPAFLNSPEQLIRALERTTAKLPEITYRVCELTVSNAINIFERTGNRNILMINSINQFLIKLYSQNNTNFEIQRKCLNLVDKLLELDPYDINQRLQQYDR